MGIRQWWSKVRVRHSGEESDRVTSGFREEAIDSTAGSEAQTIAGSEVEPKPSETPKRKSKRRRLKRRRSKRLKSKQRRSKGHRLSHGRPRGRRPGPRRHRR
jgi:hypothetical protein